MPPRGYLLKKEKDVSQLIEKIPIKVILFGAAVKSIYFTLFRNEIGRGVYENLRDEAVACLLAPNRD